MTILTLAFRLLPEQASTYAKVVDPMFWALTALTLGFCALVTTLLIVFGIVYKQRFDGRKSEHPEVPAFEIGYTLLLTAVAIGIFWWGATAYHDSYTIPKSSLQIDVMGKQWMWKVQHPNGKREVNELHVPLGRPVQIKLTSQDVLHSFYIPAFRKKTDAVPGRITTMWFEATKTGEYPLFCAEYCGTEHSVMGGRVVVLEPEEYVQWLEGTTEAETPVAAGGKLFSRLGCATCHVAGDKSRGPALQGIFGTEQEMADGTKVLANEDYIRNSIVNPTEHVVKGFTPLMPSFANQLSESDMLNLVAYVKSLSNQ